MDSRKCQTFAATPAEPGDLPYWFSSIGNSSCQVAMEALRLTPISHTE